jgi:hypothetical protein
MTKHTFELDEQGQKDLEAEVRRRNARSGEIEEESAKRTGQNLTGTVMRAFARPATEAEIETMKLEAARRKGTPPS